MQGQPELFGDGLWSLFSRGSWVLPCKLERVALLLTEPVFQSRLRSFHSLQVFEFVRNAQTVLSLFVKL